MNRSSALTIAAVIALVGMAAVPMAASAASDPAIDVEQNPDTGDTVVTVTDNGTAVENASVTVSSESAYVGTGTYDTDTNGTVALPEPNETVSVEMNASIDNSTVSTQVELVPRADSVDVSAEQADDGSVAVTVTQYDEPVENASVEIVADSDIAGNYTTDANGTVTVGQPTDDVNATVVATDSNLTDETVVQLTGVPLDVAIDQQDDGVVVTVTEDGESVENASVEIAADGDYSGAGTYETDADGEVALPLPSENVTIEVTATAGNETATATAGLTVDIVQGDQPFGLAVSRFVSALQSATVDGPPGQIISEFVVGNNPGNAADAPGQSGDAPGQSGDAGPGAAAGGNGSDGAPGQSGDAPGNSGDAPGNSGAAPGNSGDAPGQSDRDDAGNETEDGDRSGSANGDAPDDAGPDSDEDGDDADDGEEDTEAAREGDAEDESDEAEDESDEAEDEEESSEQDDDGQGNSGGNGGDSGSDSAPGNSGNAPGRN